jgi:hypothetical protein
MNDNGKSTQVNRVLRPFAPQRGDDCAKGSVVRQFGSRDAGFCSDFPWDPSPSPKGAWCDGSDNCLASRMNMNVLDRNPLLAAFAPSTV